MVFWGDKAHFELCVPSTKGTGASNSFFHERGREKNKPARANQDRKDMEGTQQKRQKKVQPSKKKIENSPLKPAARSGKGENEQDRFKACGRKGEKQGKGREKKLPRKEAVCFCLNQTPEASQRTRRW